MAKKVMAKKMMDRTQTDYEYWKVGSFLYAYYPPTESLYYLSVWKTEDFGTQNIWKCIKDKEDKVPLLNAIKGIPNEERWSFYLNELKQMTPIAVLVEYGLTYPAQGKTIQTKIEEIQRKLQNHRACIDAHLIEMEHLNKKIERLSVGQVSKRVYCPK